MNLKDIERGQWKAITGSSILVPAWILLPFYFQSRHGVSAIQVSFAITVIYYLGFRLWKKMDSR